MLSSDIKSKLISTYCMDLYGSQLWNYCTGYPETFYVAWRKVTRLIWKLPFRTHCNLLHTINNCYPIEFILEKRCIKILHSCLSSDNLVISNVVKSSCDNWSSTFGDNADILVINIILLPRSGWNHLLIYCRVCLTTCTVVLQIYL